MFISDLLAQVEGKNRLRNGTLILQLVKYGDGSREGYIGVVQAKDTIKVISSNPYSAIFGTNGLSVLTRSPICGREECSNLQIREVGARTGLG